MERAAAQHGVVSLEQLVGLGFTPSAVRMRVAAGRLHRLFRGIYSVGRADVLPAGRRLAGVLACGDGPAISHFAAGAHIGLRESSAALLDITVPRRSAIKLPRIRIHRSTTLIAEDVTVLDAVPCTSVARTLLDLAARIDDRGVERAAERAEILGIYDQRAIERILARLEGQPGSRRLARVAGAEQPGWTLTESGLEERMLALCRRWQIPEPEVNAEILLGGERAKVDFLWRRERVVVETDGFRYHGSRAAFRRDRRRDRLLELEGYRHARFADVELDGDASEVRATLERLIGGEVDVDPRRR